MSTTGFLDNVAAEWPDYLRDESRKEGCADSISFPQTGDQLRAQVEETRRRGMTVTVQGARTGISAGAVPEGGHVLNLSRLARITGLRQRKGAFLVTVEPGVLLTDLGEAVRRASFVTEEWSAESLAALESLRQAGPHFFPPDPTETTASIGGMVACNASGAQTFRYGATRRHVHRLRLVLADGDSLALERGRERAAGRRFSAVTERGRTLSGELPAYRMPAVKNAAGYFVEDDMDLLDLFVGSEGTLGVFEEIELQLIPAPACIWGVMAFLPSVEAAVGFVVAVRSGAARPGAIEYFDPHALALLESERESNPAFRELPAPPGGSCAAVYVEYHADGEGAAEEAVLAMSEALVEHGGSEDDTWLASDARELARMKDFRHAVPEAVNLRIDRRRKTVPGLTKLGTDLAVPDRELAAVMDMYRHDLDEQGLESVVFGHVGNNHVHVNILPRDLAEYERGKQLYLEWARRVVAVGGTVSAEHGIGKLKTAMLRIQYGEKGIAEMRAVKRCFDPEWRLNPGSLFEAER